MHTAIQEAIKAAQSSQYNQRGYYLTLTLISGLHIHGEPAGFPGTGIVQIAPNHNKLQPMFINIEHISAVHVIWKP